VIRVTNGSAE